MCLMCMIKFQANSDGTVVVVLAGQYTDGSNPRRTPEPIQSNIYTLSYCIHTHTHIFINPFLLRCCRHTSDTEIYNNVGRRRVGLSFLYLHLVSTASALSDISIDPYIYLYPSFSTRDG